MKQTRIIITRWPETRQRRPPPPHPLPRRPTPPSHPTPPRHPPPTPPPPYIADMIAQELGIKLYDKDSIEKEIVSEGYSEEMIRKMDEKPVNFFASRRIGKYSNSLEVNVAEKTFAMLRDKAANGESFLIIGRCGDQCSRATPIC